MLNRKGTAIAVTVRANGAPVLLSDAALAAGVHLDLRCGGNGICGRCKVEWDGKWVLACQTQTTRDGIMRIPRAALAPEELAVESAFAPPVPRHASPRCRHIEVRVPAARERPGVDDWERLCLAAFDAGPRPCINPEVLRRLPALLERGRPVRLTVLDDEVLDIEDAGTRGRPVLGAAIDVGTTTVVVRLLDLVTGEQLALAGARNRQAGHGANVISRIALGSTAHGLNLLRQLVAEKTIVPLIEKCMAQANLRGVPIRRAAVGGNTCMMHLLLGLSPKGLGTVPFNAVSLAPAPVSGAALGLPVERVECIPAAGAYIGGDVLGGMYVVGLDRDGPPEMLIDVGTNSEILLRAGGKLYGASAAAGPAFEGGELSSGGPATPGAIAHLRFTEKGFRHVTCGKAAPTHVCGSAYVDFLAEGRKHGFLLEHGRFAPGFAQAETFTQPGENGQQARLGRRCLLSSGVTVDDHDVSLLLQAKAATLAGALILLRKAGVAPQDLHALHVAGGFGRHLDPAHAVRIGLLPPVPLERIKVVGNTSLAAASSALLNAHATREIRALALRVQVVELNLEPDFQDCFINALSMP